AAATALHFSPGDRFPAANQQPDHRSLPELLQFRADDRLLAATPVGTRRQLWEIAQPHEYRTLAWDKGTFAGAGRAANAAVSPDNRLVAVGTSRGVSLLELSSGKPLALLEEKPSANAVLWQGSRALISSGFPAGMFRWPIQHAPGCLHVGPPERLSLPKAPYEMAHSSTRALLARLNNPQGVVPHRDGPGKRNPRGATRRER